MQVVIEYIKDENFKYVRLLGEWPPHPFPPCLLVQLRARLCSHMHMRAQADRPSQAAPRPSALCSSVAAAGAFYMRLVGRPLEVYQYLEPLYNDYRKVLPTCRPASN